MPTAPLKPCAEPACHRTVPRGTTRCAEHHRKPFAGATRSTNLYRTHRWRLARARFLVAHPCCWCGAQGKVVDHVIPHRGDAAVFWNESNWQTLCWRHSNSKTAREVGRGRAVRKLVDSQMETAGQPSFLSGLVFPDRIREFAHG